MKAEGTGKTLDAAVENAAEKLGITPENAEVTVIQESGFLKQCKVEVSKKQSDGERVKEFLENVLEKMGFDKFAAELTEDGEVIRLEIIGADKGNVIGYRGETLDALQYLCSLIANSCRDGFKRVVLDSEGYREKREKTLQQLAKNLELKVKRTGQPVKLEPMNPYERRIIHTSLQNSNFVSTESEGLANNRSVVISPKLGGDILNAPASTGRKSLNFVYRSDKKRRKR